MRLVKVDRVRDDLDRIARLLYETDVHFSSLVFGKDLERAIERLERMIDRGNNSLGFENIRAVKGEGEQIIGILNAYSGAGQKTMDDWGAFLESLGLFGCLRLAVFDVLLLRRLFIHNVKEGELYISEVCVDANHRGRGVGSFIMGAAQGMMREKGCRKDLLDVVSDNTRAIRLYEKYGFVKIRENRSIFTRVRTFTMEIRSKGPGAKNK